VKLALSAIPSGNSRLKDSSGSASSKVKLPTSVPTGKFSSISLLSKTRLEKVSQGVKSTGPLIWPAAGPAALSHQLFSAVTELLSVEGYTTIPAPLPMNCDCVIETPVPRVDTPKPSTVLFSNRLLETVTFDMPSEPIPTVLSCAKRPSKVIPGVAEGVVGLI